MISVRRLLLASITLVFGAFNVALAMLRLDRYNDTLITVSIGLFYFISLVACTVAFRKLKLPIWVASIISVVAVLIPKISHLTLRGDGVDTYDTWYVTAVGLLLGALAVRGREVFAIIAGFIFSVEVVYFCGFDFLPKSGLSGAVILIVACIAVSRGLASSAKEIAEAQHITETERAAIATQEVLSEIHSFAKTVALKATLPTLRKIAGGKSFSKEQRLTYAKSELELRDEIAGGRLVNKKTKRAMAAARARGVDVALLDDGGLELLSQEELDDLLDLVAESLSGINSGRVTVRTQRKENWLVRFTASRPRVVTPDLDLKLGQR